MGLFDEHIEKLSDAKLDPLRAKNLGDLSLDEVVDRLMTARSEFEAANVYEPADFPTSVLVNAGNFATHIQQLTSEMASYPGTGSHAQTRESLRSQVEAFLDQVRTMIRPNLPREGAEIVSRELNKARDDLTQLKGEVENALTTLRSDAADSAATDLAEHYRDAATDHEKAAKVFLHWGIGAVAALGIGSVLAFFVFPPTYQPESDSTEQVIDFTRNALGRIVLLSLAAFVVGFAFRNYRVNKHLGVLNDRRAIALETSNRLRAAMNEAEAQNIVVAELVRAIFSGEETGYLGSEGEKTVIESPGSTLTAITAMSRAR